MAVWKSIWNWSNEMLHKHQLDLTDISINICEKGKSLLSIERSICLVQINWEGE